MFSFSKQVMKACHMIYEANILLQKQNKILESCQFASFYDAFVINALQTYSLPSSMPWTSCPSTGSFRTALPKHSSIHTLSIFHEVLLHLHYTIAFNYSRTAMLPHGLETIHRSPTVIIFLLPGLGLCGRVFVMSMITADWGFQKHVFFSDVFFFFFFLQLCCFFSKAAL